MRTKQALTFLSQTLLGQDPPEREGPLDKIADRLLAEEDARETARMEHAQARAAIAGKGALIDAVQDYMRTIRGSALIDTNAPVLTNFDAYTAVKDASYERPNDRGLKSVAFRLYKRWTDEISGSLSLGELSKIAAQASREHPQTNLGDVLEETVLKSGYQTLKNLPQLARIAGQIKTQADYDSAVLANGLDRPEAFHARAFIQALVGRTAEVQARPTTESAATRTLARIGAGDDIALNELEPETSELAPIQEDEVEESASIESPISGEMLTLELGVEANGMVPDDIQPSISSTPQLGPEKIEKMEMMGQLNDMIPGAVDAVDDGMEPPQESSTIAIDPSTGQEVEITMRPVKEPESGPESEPVEPMAPIEASSNHCAEHNCASQQCADLHKTAMKKFFVYATIDGKTAPTPIDQYQARSMRDMLARLAGFGVKGDVLYSAENDEAAVVLNDTKGDYLHIVADVFEPKINQQQPDAVSVPEDGAAALKQTTELKQIRPKRKVKSREDVQSLCHWMKLSADQIEGRILNGETVTKHGWQIFINPKDEVEFKSENSTSRGRTASMVGMDDLISDFQAAVASELPEVDEEFGIITTAMFEAKCASCTGVSEYLMPEEALPLRCGSCNKFISVERIAARFAEKEDFSGYHFEVQIPRGRDLRDFDINHKRVLAEVNKVVGHERVETDPLTQKLSFVVRGADAAAVARIERVLRGVFGIVEAQISPVDKLAPAAKDPAVQGLLGQPLSKADAPSAANLDPLDKAKMAQLNDVPDLGSTDEAFAPPPPGVMEAPSEGPMDGPAMDLSMGGPGGNMGLGGEMPIEDGPGGPMFQPGAAPVDEIGEEAMHAAILHYRNQGLGVLEALAEFKREYSDYLEQFGDEASPERHLAEAEVVRVAGEIYAKPALVQRAAMMVENAMRIFADVYSPKVNTQQPDQISQSGLDPDHEKDDMPGPSKINTQVAPQGKFSDTNPGGDSEKGHKAPTPAKPSPQSGSQHKQPGTSFSNTDLGRDNATGEVPSTKKMDSLSKAAPNTPRSK